MKANGHLEATRLTRRLAIGSRPPIGETVHRAGFDIVLLCAEEYQPPGVLFPNVKVIHCPLDDGSLPPDEARRAVKGGRLVANAIRSGYSVLVTCQQGRNRSGLVCAVALCELTGEDPVEVIQYIQAKREGALSNPSFTAFLTSASADAEGTSRRRGLWQASG